MTHDKLEEHRAPQTLISYTSMGWDNSEDSRTRLIHTALRMIAAPFAPLRFAVDFCFFVFSEGPAVPGQPYCFDTRCMVDGVNLRDALHFPTIVYAADWESYPRTVGAKGEHCLSMGEPVQLHILLDADGLSVGRDSEVWIGDRLSQIAAAPAGLNKTFEAVYQFVVDASHRNLTCRSATIHGGWHDRIADPDAYIGAVGEGDGEVFASSPCAARMRNAWHGIASAPARSVALPIPLDEGYADPADDFMSGRKLSSLWYRRR